MPNFSSEQLRSLLSGKLTDEQENEIAQALESDQELRNRLELISGSGYWAIGSAPVQTEPDSASLQSAIERVVSESRIERLSSSALNESEALAEIKGLDQSAEGTGSMAPVNMPGIRIVREIGRGGMGIVYEGWDELVGRKVAVKQLHPIRSRNPDARELLLQEARAAGSLSHPNIVNIYSVHLQNDMPVLVHQYVEGETLQDRIDNKQLLSWQECVEMAKQIAAGLDAAHSAGIVHRDLKPDNILIERSTQVIRIADFGIAKQSATSGLTTNGKVAGTPAYMSPEQTKGESLDARSDLFSLGSLLVAALTGTPPFGLVDPFVVMDRIRTQEPNFKGSLDPSVPAWFVQTIEKLLVKERDQRMADASQLQQALSVGSSRSEVAASPTTTPKWKIAAVVAASIMACVVWLTWTNNRNARTTANMSTASNVTTSNSKTIEVGPNDAFVPTQPVWIRRSAAQFESLASAIEAAKDGDTIEIGSDLACRSILINKRLTIKGTSGKRLLLTSASDSANPADAYFLRAETDLTLEGIDIDWKSLESPLFDERRLNAVIASGPGSRLTINDCRIKRSSVGVNIATAGNLDIHRSVIEGGSFALAWLGVHSHATIEESVLDSRIGVAVMFPLPNVAIYTKSVLKLKNSVIHADDAVSFMLTRRPEHRVQIKTENCIFDSDHTVSLMTFNLNVREQCESNGPTVLGNSVEWRESRCVHRLHSEHLVSRRIKSHEWPYKLGISDLSRWLSLVRSELSEDQKSIAMKLTRQSEEVDTFPLRSYRMEPDAGTLVPLWVSQLGQTGSKHAIIDSSH